MMKNKKRLELNKLSSESPTLTNIRERNGIINPAFLSTPGSADILPDEQHNNHIHYNQNNDNQPRNQYNTNNWSNHVNQNGVDSQTSSWVYNFNQSYIPESATLPIHSRYKEYPENRYVKDDHLVYDIDLNDEHARNSKSLIKRKCCKTLLHLFVWCVIAVSLMGIAISVAFIVYIEKIAKCSGSSSNQIQVPNITIAQIANSSSTTLSSFGISDQRNATERPTTTSFGVNTTTLLLSNKIMVSSLSPFDFNDNYTSTGFPITSNNSIMIGVNNLTTTETHMSLENHTNRDNERDFKFITLLSANRTANSSANDNSSAIPDSIYSLNRSQITGDFNISHSNDSTTLFNDSVSKYYADNVTNKANDSLVTPLSIKKAFNDFLTNDSYNNNDNNATLDRLNATAIDIMDTSALSPLPIMADNSTRNNNTRDWSDTYTTVATVINHRVVANVAFNMSTDFENVFKSSTNAINHETVNLTDLSLTLNRTATPQPQRQP